MTVHPDTNSRVLLQYLGDLRDELFEVWLDVILVNVELKLAYPPDTALTKLLPLSRPRAPSHTTGYRLPTRNAMRSSRRCVLEIFSVIGRRCGSPT